MKPLLFTAAFALAAVRLCAQAPDTTPDAAPSAGPPKLTDDQLRIRGVFNTALPGTEKKNSLRFIFHPHFGDFTQKDYLRIPVGLRYGLTDNWEVTGEVEGYVSHGFGDVPAFKEYGFSNIHFGTKYHLKEQVLGGWDSAVGFDYIQPVSHPPMEVTDGLTHMVPFMSFSRRLERDPRWRVFWGFGADLINKTDVPGKLEKNELGDDSVNVTGGVVWDRNRWHYTFESQVATSAGIGAPNNGTVVTLRPGVVWDVPEKYTRWIGGRWVLGVAGRASHGPDGFDFGAGAKVRVDFDFKKLIGRRPKAIDEK